MRPPKIEDLVSLSEITDKVATAMWSQDAKRSGSDSVAANRTLEAFKNEADSCKDKWRGLALAALMVVGEELSK